jgi:hypothetical protein
MVFSVLVDMDCCAGRYAAIALTESIWRSTGKTVSVVLAKHKTAP